MSDIKVVIERVYLPTETLGSWYINGEMICKTMELPWKENQNNISCIPEDTYLVTKEPPIPKDDPNTPEDESLGRKARSYWHFRLHNVPKRKGILVHLITYVSGLLGCIGVGMKFADFNKDGVPDIENSSKALELLVSLLPDTFYLTIRKKEV